MKKCITCYGEFPEDTFSAINDDGTKVCARCVFLIALYHVRGIKKTFQAGCLHPDALNSEFKKIIKTEFNKNPHAAYKKYLGGMIREEEEKRRIIYIDEPMFDRIAADFPFCPLKDDDFKRFQPVPGEPITLKVQNTEKEIIRTVYAVNKILARTAKAYGLDTKARNICFIPPAEYYI